MPKIRTNQAIKKNIKKLPRQICATCGSTTNKFYASRNIMNAYYGKMPWCQSCIDGLYQNLYQQYQDNYKAMDAMCQILNIPFVDSIYKKAKSRLEEDGIAIYGGYFMSYNSVIGKVHGVVYSDSSKFVSNEILDSDRDTQETEIDKDLIRFWGKGFNDDDYDYLEWNLAEWKKTHSCTNQAETSLLREICIKELELRKVRDGTSLTKDTDKITKELQSLMKTAAVDPAKANVASSGKAVDAFGVWIKDIEQYRPCEWHDQQEQYKDMDGFGDYIQKYILRPIKNFITGSRDFGVDPEFMVDFNGGQQ